MSDATEAVGMVLRSCSTTNDVVVGIVVEIVVELLLLDCLERVRKAAKVGNGGGGGKGVGSTNPDFVGLLSTLVDNSRRRSVFSSASMHFVVAA